MKRLYFIESINNFCLYNTAKCCLKGSVLIATTFGFLRKNDAKSIRRAVGFCKDRKAANILAPTLDIIEYSISKESSKHGKSILNGLSVNRSFLPE